MNADKLTVSVNLDQRAADGVITEGLLKKGVVSVKGELYALGPVMPGDVKPVHSGWYARNYGNWRSERDYYDPLTGWWRGRKDGSKVWPNVTPQNLQWRGISVEPNAQAIADAMFYDAKRLASKPHDERQENFAAGFITGNPCASGEEAKDVAQQYASCLDANTHTGTSGSNQVPPFRNPTTPAPDTRDANDLPAEYFDPEGFLFDLDGVKSAKVIGWALAAIIVVVLLAAWWAA